MSYAVAILAFLHQDHGVGAYNVLVSLDLLAIADEDKVCPDRIVAHLCDACERSVGHVVKVTMWYDGNRR